MNKLRGIARALTQTAEASGIARRQLQRGLHLTLRYDAGRWALSLSRFATQASDIERQICRDAFGVPEGAEVEVVYVNGYGVTRYTWGEPVEATQASFLPEAGPVNYYGRG